MFTEYLAKARCADYAAHREKIIHHKASAVKARSERAAFVIIRSGKWINYGRNEEIRRPDILPMSMDLQFVLEMDSRLLVEVGK